MTEFKKEDVKELNIIVESLDFDYIFYLNDIKKILNFKELKQTKFEYFAKILNDYECAKVKFENSDEISSTTITKNGNTSYFIEQGGFEKVFNELEQSKIHKTNTFYNLKNAKLKHWLFIPTTVLAFIGGLKTLYEWTNPKKIDKPIELEQKSKPNKSELKNLKSDSTYVLQTKIDNHKTD